ncbi:MAG: zf-HC2 domain-containing protein [Ignavibacteriales bacterium]|nr:zf-HC2 domain-containing protein [Ignavibacteriales bacterium]
MKHDDILILLPDYHEGTLAGEQAQAVERHLAACADCTRMSDAIAFGFSELRKESVLEVPPQYFNNLIPRLHERMERPQRRLLPVFFPPWAQPLLAPFSAAGVVIGVAALYVLLSTLPAQDGSLHGLVAQLPPDELVRLTDLETTLSESLAHQPILDATPNAALVTGHLEHQLLAEGTSFDSYSVTSGSDESVIETLSDDEVTNVIDHLSQTKTL